MDYPIVFTDFHHASLLQSLILLFEKRMGGMVFRPIGTEWFEKGFWKVYDHPATVQQFLGINGATPDGTPPLNQVMQAVNWGGKVREDGTVENDGTTYFCHDIDSGKTNRAITYDAFFKAKVNIVIASLPYHIEPFKRLCEMHPNKPKLIYQIGNAWTVEAGLAPNIMASAKITGVPEGTNFIEYHQEFDTEIFKPDFDREAGANIFSFVNVFNGQAHFAADWALFQQIEAALPGWNFKSYGGQCRDGAVGPSEVLAETMQKARFIWHTKAGGDGYGHIIHNAFAVGKPLIVKAEYYRGKLAEPLIKDGETCITIDGLSINDIVNKIRHYNDPARYFSMSRAAYNQFTRLCNFDTEFIHLKTFMEKLL